MNNDIIIRCALEARYSGINFDALMDVINATPNKDVATIKLLGLYQRPTLQTERQSHPEYNGRFGTYTLTDYNEYTERVSFTGEYYEEITRWAQSEEEGDAMIEHGVYNDNEDLPGKTSQSDLYCFIVKLQRKRKTETWCTVADWNGPERTF